MTTARPPSRRAGFPEASGFEKILKTCVGIANMRRGYRGYVLCGIADKARTAARVREVFGVEGKKVLNFWVMGVEHEAHYLSKNSDQMFQWVVDRASNSSISSPLREYVARNIKPIRYFDKTVYVFEVEGQEDVSQYGGLFYDRSGAQLKEVRPEEIAFFVKRYIIGG